MDAFLTTNYDTFKYNLGKINFVVLYSALTLTDCFNLVVMWILNQDVFTFMRSMMMYLIKLFKTEKDMAVSYTPWT